MLRIFSISLLFLLFSIQSAHGIMMNNQGLDTGKGFITWEQLINLPKQMNSIEQKVQILQNVCIIGSVFAAGLFVYLKWFSQSVKQNANQFDNSNDTDMQPQTDNLL